MITVRSAVISKKRREKKRKVKAFDIVARLFDRYFLDRSNNRSYARTVEDSIEAIRWGRFDRGVRDEKSRLDY